MSQPDPIYDPLDELSNDQLEELAKKEGDNYEMPTV